MLLTSKLSREKEQTTIRKTKKLAILRHHEELSAFPPPFKQLASKNTGDGVQTKRERARVRAAFSILDQGSPDAGGQEQKQAAIVSERTQIANASLASFRRPLCSGRGTPHPLVEPLAPTRPSTHSVPSPATYSTNAEPHCGKKPKGKKKRTPPQLQYLRPEGERRCDRRTRVFFTFSSPSTFLIDRRCFRLRSRRRQQPRLMVHTSQRRRVARTDMERRQRTP